MLLPRGLNRKNPRNEPFFWAQLINYPGRTQQFWLGFDSPSGHRFSQDHAQASVYVCEANVG